MFSLDRKSAPTRRDRRFQRKQQEILIAATRVFAQKGFTGATTKDIADEAAIGESTLYNYFDSKREILLAILDETRVSFDALFQEVSAVTSREDLVDLLDRFLAVFLARVGVTRTILSEAWVDDDILKNHLVVRLQQVSQILEGFITEQIKAGMLRPVDPAMGARLIIGMYFALLLPVLRGIEPPPSPEQRRSQAETVISLLLDGLRNRDGESI